MREESNRSLTRRRFLRLAALGAGAALLGGCAPATPPAPVPPAQPAAAPAAKPPVSVPAPASGAAPAPAAKAGRSIVVPSYGGVWEKAHREVLFPCFEAKTGLKDNKVLVGAPGDWMAKIEATVSQEPALDLFLGGPLFVIQAADKGLLEKFDETRVPNAKNVPAKFKELYGGYAVESHGSIVALGYNKDRVKKAPDTWQELVDRVVSGQDIGRGIGFPGLTTGFWSQVLLILAITYGGGIDNITPGIDKLKAMKKNIVRFQESSAEQSTGLANGEVDMAIVPEGRVWDVVDKGATFLDWKILRPTSPVTSIAWGKVKNGSPASWDYLNCLFDAQVGSNFINTLQYLNYNPKGSYTPAMLNRLPPSVKDGSFSEVYIAPFREIDKRSSEWAERWRKEL